jgi:hypothetical protein
MNSKDIYHHLKHLHLKEFDLMLADLRELKGRISDCRDDWRNSDLLRLDGLEQVEDSITMVITTLRYAIAADASVSLDTLKDIRSDLHRHDFCRELRKTISNAVFVNARNIDS